MSYTWQDFDRDKDSVEFSSTATYWNGKDFVPYPELVVKVARGFWIASNDALDRHVRPTPWEDWQDPRMGTFAGAARAVEICKREGN